MGLTRYDLGSRTYPSRVSHGVWGPVGRGTQILGRGMEAEDQDGERSGDVVCQEEVLGRRSFKER